MTTHGIEIDLLKRALAAADRSAENLGIVLVDDQGTPVSYHDTTMDPHVREALEKRLKEIE